MSHTKVKPAQLRQCFFSPHVLVVLSLHPSSYPFLHMERCSGCQRKWYSLVREEEWPNLVRITAPLLWKKTGLLNYRVKSKQNRNKKMKSFWHVLWDMSQQNTQHVGKQNYTESFMGKVIKCLLALHRHTTGLLKRINKTNLCPPPLMKALKGVMKDAVLHFSLKYKNKSKQKLK